MDDLKEKKICDYGCGKEAKYQFKNGKWCCSKKWQSCEAMKIINSQTHINKVGKPCSKETRLKISKANKGKKRSKEARINIGKSSKGRIPWNKGKTGIYSEETLWEIGKANRGKEFSKKRKRNMSKASLGNKSNKGKNISKEIKNKLKLSLNQIKERYPTFSKVEEIRYNPDKPGEKEIQVHCKNHNCPNSKEQGGWFTPFYMHLYERIRQIENIDGNQAGYLYCSEECKEECPLYGKHVTQLIKEDQIRAGYLEDPWYNSQEYQTWRQQVFELDKGLCVYCEEPAEQSHHILPQKTHPNLALDPENGLSVCIDCHYKYGHRDSWCTTGYLSKLVCERIIKIKKKGEIDGQISSTSL